MTVKSAADDDDLVRFVAAASIARTRQYGGGAYTTMPILSLERGILREICIPKTLEALSLQGW